jgi:BlaI family transcriptional regulator, penicillinase repressor
MWEFASRYLTGHISIFFVKDQHNILFVRNISYLRFMKTSKKNPNVEPTRSELEILQVLWQHGPSTVRFVNDQLNEQKRAVQYTSTLKLMQIMVEKGLLNRDETNMKHIYSAAAEEQETKNLVLDRFLDQVYNGSASSLMMQLLGNKKASKKELQAIKDLLNKLDKEKQ